MLQHKRRRVCCFLLSCVLVTAVLSVVTVATTTEDPEAASAFHITKTRSRRIAKTSGRPIRGAPQKHSRKMWLEDDDDQSSLFVDQMGVLRKRPKDEDDVEWYSYDEDPGGYTQVRPRGPKLTAPPGYGQTTDSECSNSLMVNNLLHGTKYGCGCTNDEQINNLIRGNTKCHSTSTSKSLKSKSKKSKTKSSKNKQGKGTQKGCTYAQKVKNSIKGKYNNEDCGCSNTERVNNLLRGSKYCDNKTQPNKSAKHGKSSKTKKSKQSKSSGYKNKKGGGNKHMFGKWKQSKKLKGVENRWAKKSGHYDPFAGRRRPKPVIGVVQPTGGPTLLPTVAPSISSAPTDIPSLPPSQLPSDVRSAGPSSIPTGIPSISPTSGPSRVPTFTPTANPSVAHSLTPSFFPTSTPTLSPTINPTASPVPPTLPPTGNPTQSPSKTPSHPPTSSPTGRPSSSPTGSPTTTPSRSPTGTPTVPPTPTPTSPPTTAPPIPNPGCVPTIGLGDCLSTVEQLARTLPLASKGSVIGVCGDPNPILIGERLRIMTGGVTFCCADAIKPCILQSTGEDMILETRGGQIDLIDLIFRNGTNPDPKGEGGNVRIQGYGDPHRIVRCTFEGGQSNIGGNLYFSTTGEVQITGSSFIDGFAITSGGGLAVDGATQVVLDGSNPIDGPTVFRGNTAGAEGGAFFTTRVDISNDSGQRIDIKGTVFDLNSANIGGAVAVSELGYLPSLTILETNFTDNMAIDNGGAGAFVQIIEGISVSFGNNTGSGNIAGTGDCPDFLTFDKSSGTDLCIPVNENYP